MPLLAGSAALITDEVTESIARMARQAAGTLVPADFAPTGDKSKVYLKAPAINGIEFIFSQTIGMPGANIKSVKIKEGDSAVHQSAKDKETGINYRGLMYETLEMLRAALPMAIERLQELCIGVTVQRTRGGKTYTITQKPSIRAIEFVMDHVTGKSASILRELLDRFNNPATDHEHTKEELDKMTRAELLALKNAWLNQYEPVEEATDNPADATSHSQDSNNGEPEVDEDELGDIVELPLFVTQTRANLLSFLPVAISSMKISARGARTIIDTETERLIIDHEPDTRANAFFINRFMGKPKSNVRIEEIVEKSAYDREIERVTPLYPELIEKYGSIDAIVTAYAKSTSEAKA